MTVRLNSDAVFIRAGAFRRAINVLGPEMKMLNRSFSRLDRALLFRKLRREIVVRRHFDRSGPSRLLGGPTEAIDGCEKEDIQEIDSRRLKLELFGST
jgi:hypothetical protein